MSQSPHGWWGGFWPPGIALRPLQPVRVWMNPTVLLLPPPTKAAPSLLGCGAQCSRVPLPSPQRSGYLAGPPCCDNDISITTWPSFKSLWGHAAPGGFRAAVPRRLDARLPAAPGCIPGWGRRRSSRRAGLSPLPVRGRTEEPLLLREALRSPGRGCAGGTCPPLVRLSLPWAVSPEPSSACAKPQLPAPLVAACPAPVSGRLPTRSTAGCPLSC